MDGLPRLESVFRGTFPRARTQCCQKHAKANACLRVRKSEREAFSNDLNQVFYAMDEPQARLAFDDFKARWQRWFPSAVHVVEKDLDSLLSFFFFDTAYTAIYTLSLHDALPI